MADLVFSYNGQQFDSANESVTKTLDTAGKYLESDITVTYDKSAATSGTATANKILSGYTAYVNGSKVTGNIPSKSARTYTPTTSDQMIASGNYLSGTQTIKGDANLIPANIAQGISIFGVTGTHSGGVTPITITLVSGTGSWGNEFVYTDPQNELQTIVADPTSVQAMPGIVIFPSVLSNLGQTVTNGNVTFYRIATSMRPSFYSYAGVITSDVTLTD